MSFSKEKKTKVNHSEVFSWNSCSGEFQKIQGKLTVPVLDKFYGKPETLLKRSPSAGSV